MNLNADFQKSNNFTYKTLFKVGDNSRLEDVLPKHSSDFDFEHYTGVTGILEFLETSWQLPFIIAFVYMGVIFWLQHFMRKRKPIELRNILLSWNILIGVFSFVGFMRTAPELLSMISKPNGFYESICLPKPTYRFLFWAAMFGISKVPELLDTVFVVLRKKPLEAVQWYHHVVTMIGCLVNMPFLEPVNRYLVVINFGVHGVMYPYFALKVAGIKVPRFIAKTITTCQLVQMIVLMTVYVVSALIHLSGSAYCHRNPFSIIYSALVVASFIGIFGKLFVKLVIKSRRGNKVKIN